MSLVRISTFFGHVQLRTVLLCITLLNLAAGVIIFVDELVRFLPPFSLGDIYESLVFTETTPRVFGAVPPAIFICFTLVMLYGVYKSKPKCLYAYALYGVARIGTWFHMVLMLVASIYDDVDYTIALTSRYVLNFTGGLAYQIYLLLLVRALITQIVLKSEDSHAKIISVWDSSPDKDKAAPSAPPGYDITNPGGNSLVSTSNTKSNLR